MRLYRWFIISFVLFQLSCTGKQPFDFASDWNWYQLKNFTVNDSTRANIDSLENLIALEDARYLLEKLDQLQNPAAILNLKTIEADQISAGGGFYGIFPNFYQDSVQVPIPKSFDSKIETALFLANQRKQVFDIINNPSFPYNRQFSGQKIDIKPIKPFTSELSLKIDISAIQSVLDYYDSSDKNEENSIRIANHRVYKNMLQHRKDLGYLPEPLPTTEDIAGFIMNSCRKDPVYQIWNWINPCNFFCFSDLYLNREEFRDLIEYIDNNQEQFEYRILKKIDKVTPAGFTFSDQISFGVNFGIRSWATRESIGTNIVQVKDNFDALLRTMRHEIFHHVQLSLTRLSPDIVTKNNPDFSDLTYWNFKSETDKKFYETLAYIFLEGTATYIGGLDSMMNVTEQSTKGIELLNKIYLTIYKKNEPDKVDRLLTEGLKSNGPFYALGYSMISAIEQDAGTKEIQRILQLGPVDFFIKYNQLETELTLNTKIQGKIENLYEKMKGSAQ